MIPLKLEHLLESAKRNASTPTPTVCQLEGVIFTPKAACQLIGIEGLGATANFLDPTNHAELMIVSARIQPGVYLKHVLPYKDRLVLEITELVGIKQYTRRYKCTPLNVMDTNKESNQTPLLNPEALDVSNFIVVKFQLIDLAYDAMRNENAEDCFLLGTVGDCLHSLMTKACAMIEYDGMAKYEGFRMRLPTDNPKVYQSLTFPQGTPLTQAASYAQEQYGVYSSGIGSFFKDGYWDIFSLWDFDAYDTDATKLDIMKVPEDYMPTLDASYYVNGEVTSIIATGEAIFQSQADVNHQNIGTGQQIISSDTIAGNTGQYYNAGRALTTRADSVSEYRTVNRGNSDNDERIRVNPKFTNNLCREVSKTRSADGEVVVVQWDNADFSKLRPGVAVQYFFINEHQILVGRRGKLAGYRRQYQADGVQGVLKFRRYVNLFLFLELDEHEV